MANVTHHETDRPEDHGSMPIRDETGLLRAMPPTFMACEISRPEPSDSITADGVGVSRETG
jgi:hypothetical protein